MDNGKIKEERQDETKLKLKGERKMRKKKEGTRKGRKFVFRSPEEEQERIEKQEHV